MIEKDTNNSTIPNLATDTSPLFSIIIPIYNAEPYLTQCIDSVLQQTFRDYELILVNDGSTDQSGNICDSYQYHKHVRVIHKLNGGASNTRNCGMKFAQGEYILFLDADDFWGDVSFLSTAAEAINHHHPDVIIFGYIKQYKNGLQHTIQYASEETSRCLSLEEAMALGIFNICACDKIIRREILVKHHIIFRDKAYSEDIEWGGHIFIHAESCIVLKEVPYVYRQRTDSVSHSLSEKKLKNIIENFQHCINLRTECPPSKQKSYNVYLAKILSMLMIDLSVLPVTKQQNYYPIIRDNLSILSAPMNRSRERIIFWATRCLGLKVTIFLLGWLYKFLNRKIIS